MRMPFINRRLQGQTSLEYVLLLAVVAVVVIASFGKGSLIDKVHDSAQGYYNTVTRVIMDSDGAVVSAKGGLTDVDNPNPINGGWCPVTCPAAGFGPDVMYGACECPAPVFGGLYCPQGSVSCPAGQTCPGGQKVTCAGVTACGSCPTGQVCVPVSTTNPTGCACPNNLICSAIANSSPDATCTKCNCNQGYYWDGITKSCLPHCLAACTTWNGTACVAVTCPSNSYCDSTKPVSQECQCNRGAYWNGSACVYCPQCQSYDSVQNKCVDASKTICPASGNWSCDANVAPSQECQCWTYFKINATGTGCIPAKS